MYEWFVLLVASSGFYYTPIKVSVLALDFFTRDNITR